MPVILRLQGLNVEAGPEDIRRFFHGLPIPDGGVHITGGGLGEAFIIFNSERAGQLAMLRSLKPLRGSPVTLYESSMAELKHKMESKLKRRKCDSVGSETVPQPDAAAKLWTNLLLGVAAVVQELQPAQQMNPVWSSPVSTTQLAQIPKLATDAIGKSPKADQKAPVKNRTTVTKPTRPVEKQDGRVREAGSCKPAYLRLYGLPVTTTKPEVCQFLKGLKVVDVITDTLQGQDRCCLVKMANFKEAEEGLKYSCAGPRDIQVRLAHERMWENATRCLENTSSPTISEQDRFSPDRRLYGNLPVKRPWSFGGSPKRRRLNTLSVNSGYCVMVRNLPTSITKSRIRELFSCYDIPNNKILHLLDKQRERTSTAFIIFTEPEDYTLAMNMNGSLVGSQIIDVSSITMEKMNDLLRNRPAESEGSWSCSSQTWDSRPVLACIYARNFPGDVRKAEVKTFFGKYNLGDEDVQLLEDENGNGIGEVVIHFGCEDRARAALSLHGEHFRQEAILLACISTKQMRDLLHKTR